MSIGSLSQSARERDYLRRQYEQIDYHSPALRAFLDEVHLVLRQALPLERGTSFLDIGCGRGYFLRYLAEAGFERLHGLEPCEELLETRLFEGIEQGTFENNRFRSGSVDVVFTCHTLHHLAPRRPLHALLEMCRISRKYVVVVEINNTNLPMLAVSLLLRRVERNAYSYNLGAVRSMMDSVSVETILARNLDSLYISGNGALHRLLARIGAPPYNIVIGAKAEK